MTRRSIRLCVAIVGSACAVVAAQSGRTAALDGLLLRGGELIDGTGAPARRADVRIAGDMVTEIGVGLTPRAGERAIDVAGQVVAPGFIDMHSHANGGINQMPDAATQVRQGITTAIVGEDGSSDLPIADFYDDIERLHPAINFATAIGHGTVRSAVMGGDFKRPATRGEIEVMKALVDRGMKDGAIALSSGLEYMPGYYASTDELVALGAVAAKYGGYYTSHVRTENANVFDAWREAIEIGRRNHMPVEITHIKVAVKPVWGRAADALKMIEDARREGLKVMASWYPYPNWSSSIYVLLDDTRDFYDRKAWTVALDEIGGAGNVLVTSYRPDPSLNNKTLAEIAAARGKDAETTAMDMIREAGPDVGVIGTAMTEEDLLTFAKSPLTLICSDGSMTGRHPRGYGTFPRVLARYVRDLHALTLPEAIAKMTSRTAAFAGLPDRGTLAVGKKADVTVFDPKTIQDRGVPANPAQSPVGISYVIVNGEVVLEGGEMTAARPGRGLRRANWQPATSSDK